jgi:ABC-2 type transport system permease protein
MVIHPEKLRWLLWLRWKQFYRSFTRDRSRVIGAIFMVIFGLPMFGGIAILTFFGYRLLPPPANIGLLYLVWIGVYMAWIVLPLLEYNVNEGLDLSKLSLFPLTHAELMTSLVLSTLLDIPTLALLLIFAAVVVGWAISVPVALFAVLAMLVFYIQVVGMSQLVLALLMRTLQSRRFRDLSIIIIILFSSSCGILGQFVGRFANGLPGFMGGVAGAAAVLQWLPPGMAARSIQQAVVGEWGFAFAWLVALMAVNILVLYLWQAVIERALTSPEEGGTVRPRHHRERRVSGVVQPETAATRFWERLLSPQVLAIANKEAKYYWRDPQLKAVVFQSIISGVFFIVWPLIGFGGRSSGGVVSWWLVLFAPLAVFFFMLSLSFNSLGMERQSLTELFLFPVEPQRILWGKNLTVFAMGLIELVVLVLASSFLSHAWNLTLPTLAVGLAGIGVTLGCGNFTSVFFPQRMRQMQRGFRATGASSGNGCLRGFMSIIMLIVTAIVLIPVILAFALPIFIHAEWIWVFAIPATLLYGIAFHQTVSRLVAVRMLAREPEILALTTRE